MFTASRGRCGSPRCSPPRRPPAAEVMRRIGSEVANRGHELQPRRTASGRHDRVRHGGHEFRSAVVNRCRQTNGAATTAASWRFQRCPVPLVLLPVPRRRRDAVASSARMDNARPATEVRRIRPAFHSGGWLSLRWRGDFSNHHCRNSECAVESDHVGVRDAAEAIANVARASSFDPRRGGRFHQVPGQWRPDRVRGQRAERDRSGRVEAIVLDDHDRFGLSGMGTPNRGNVDVSPPHSADSGSLEPPQSDRSTVTVPATLAPGRCGVAHRTPSTTLPIPIPLSVTVPARCHAPI